MKRRILTLFLAAALLASCLPGERAAAVDIPEPFAPTRTYAGQFPDLDAGAWYYENAVTLYELGLINGQGGLFAPDSEMTVAEALTMAARLRSLYEHGGSETGPGQHSGGEWYTPYAAYLQELQVIGQEFEGVYQQPATRAQMAHILANVLPQTLFEPVNEAAVSAGYANKNYIQDVNPGMLYEQEILTLYKWGILGGADRTGSFRPDGHISRSEAAAMVTRLVDSSLRIRLDWENPYSRAGTTMAELVDSDGAFYPAPALENGGEIDADVRYMLSRGERSITLGYPAGALTSAMVNQLLQNFLNTVRGYVEQTYNAVRCVYSLKSGSVTFHFSSSLYGDDELDRYREETMAQAIAVHDQLWADGTITADMSQLDKARVYFTWVCDNCQYDFSTTDTSMSHTGYSLFVNGTAVCDGYTAAYNLLLKLEGIDCTTVSRGDHIWTAAELDGTVYHIDTTWGDQTGAIAYQFFAMTEADALARFGEQT